MAVDNDIYIFAYNFANVGMKPDRNGWTRCGIRELGVIYCWGLYNKYNTGEKIRFDFFQKIILTCIGGTISGNWIIYSNDATK